MTLFTKYFSFSLKLTGRVSRSLTVCLCTFLLFGNSYVFAQKEYDLLIKNGHVIDPKNHIDSKMDVAIADGKIAKVAKQIDSSQSKKTIDANRLVCCARPDRYSYARICGKQAGCLCRWYLQCFR